MAYWYPSAPWRKLSAMTAPASAPQVARQECWPSIPDKLEDLGIPRSVVADLILRYLWLHGAGTLGTLLYDGRRQKLRIIDWGTIAEGLSDKALDETVIRERY